jgi:hypothetical protein
MSGPQTSDNRSTIDVTLEASGVALVLIRIPLRSLQSIPIKLFLSIDEILLREGYNLGIGFPVDRCHNKTRLSVPFVEISFAIDEQNHVFVDRGVVPTVDQIEDQFIDILIVFRV